MGKNEKTKVCIIDTRTAPIEIVDKDLDKLSDEEFLEVATKYGNVLSLEEFQNAFNRDEKFYDGLSGNCFIRFVDA